MQRPRHIRCPHQAGYMEVLSLWFISFLAELTFSIMSWIICSEYTLVASGWFYFSPNIKAKKVVSRGKDPSSFPPKKCEQLRGRENDPDLLWKLKNCLISQEPPYLEFLFSAFHPCSPPASHTPPGQWPELCWSQTPLERWKMSWSPSMKLRKFCTYILVFFRSYWSPCLDPRAQG